MEWILANWVDVGKVVLSLLGAFSIIAKLTPTKVDDKLVDFFLKIVHSLGLTKAA